MKKSIPHCIALSMILISFSSYGLSGKDPRGRESDNDRKAAIRIQTRQLEERLHEIHSMDFTTMDTMEKRALRKEVKAIKKELTANGYVTISVGAVLLIVLLILLLR